MTQRRGIEDGVKLRRLSGAPSNAKEAVNGLLEEAIRVVSTDGKYRYKQRQLFYVLRQLIDERYPHIKLSYKNLTQEILPDASRAGFNLAGMLKEANSELTEPRGKTVSLIHRGGGKLYYLSLEGSVRDIL